MLPVYDYFDYRKLLRDLYIEQKKESPRFSYRFIGSRVGFSSAGFFSKILQGKVNISLNTAIEFTKLFKFKKQETHYFEVLVQFNQAKTHDQKKYFFEKLLAMKQAGGRTLLPEQFELFSTWYYVVIRELLDFHPCYGDFKELASLVVPSITGREAKKAVNVLLKLGLITKGPRGYYEKCDAVISTGDEWSSLAIEEFQMKTASLAEEAIRSIPKQHRDISTCTLSISGKTLTAIQERAKQFRKEVLELARADQFADHVYQLNVHLFPVSRRLDGGKG